MASEPSRPWLSPATYYHLGSLVQRGIRKNEHQTAGRERVGRFQRLPGLEGIARD